MLDLDEALESELVRAREMVVELDQPGAKQPVRLLGVPVKLSRTPGDTRPRARPGAGRAHRRGARRQAGYGADEIAALKESGAVAGAGGAGVAGASSPMDARGLLKMSELAERSGVSAGTIKHYLREGLLGDGDDVLRTSRNMAYYPPDYVERITADQAPAGGPLHAAAGDQGHARRDPERALRSSSCEDRILERALERGGGARQRAEVRAATTCRATSWTASPSSACSRRTPAATTPTT